MCYNPYGEVADRKYDSPKHKDVEVDEGFLETS
jgi:hypothetical protein